MRTFHPKWDHGGPSDYHELICKMSKRTNAARAGAPEEGGTFSHTCNVPQAPSTLLLLLLPVLSHFVYACARSQVAQKPSSFGLNLSSPSASASVKTQSRPSFSPSSSSSSKPGPARLTMLLLELRADNSKTLAALLTL